MYIVDNESPGSFDEYAFMDRLNAILPSAIK